MLNRFNFFYFFLYVSLHSDTIYFWVFELEEEGEREGEKKGSNS